MLILLLIVQDLEASDKQKNRIQYKKQTEIDFEGLEIEGELVKPQGALIQERPGTKFNPLVKLKTDFTYEIKKSVAEIK
jgi:hypothetical protein